MISKQTDLKRMNILNIPIDALTMDETVQLIDSSIQQKKFIRHVAINTDIIVKAQKDAVLKEAIETSELINADGIWIVWASRFLKQSLPERISATDLMGNLVKLAAEKNYKIFFLGAREEIVKATVDVYEKKYSKNIISGYRNGYFKKEDEINVARQIGVSGADILFVAISSPIKEIFLHRYQRVLGVPFIMGVGGAFDVISGSVQRAPIWIQKCGFEWFYRFLQEPRRMWKRYLFGNSKFIWMVLREKFRQMF